MFTVVVTGAGISRVAGLPTFREPGGIWTDEKFLEQSRADRYGNHLDALWPHWAAMHEAARAAKPTLAHRVIADAGWTVITQNIDGLHQRAGSEAIEVHGSLSRARCLRCRAVYEFARVCLKCGSTKTRPDIVLFGERLRRGAECLSLVRRAERVIFVGTSGSVFPVAEWYRLARYSVLVDPEPWGDFDEHVPISADEWALTL